MMSAARLANVPVPCASTVVTAGELALLEPAFTTLVILGKGTSEDLGLAEGDVEPILGVRLCLALLDALTVGLDASDAGSAVTGIEGIGGIVLCDWGSGSTGANAVTGVLTGVWFLERSDCSSSSGMLGGRVRPSVIVEEPEYEPAADPEPVLELSKLSKLLASWAELRCL